MRKILFLDIDGVLNSKNSWEQDSLNPLGEIHLNLLKRIIDETDCEIVLSSSWRMYKDSKKILSLAFESHKIPLWIGQTPDLCDERWKEINQWIVNEVDDQQKLNVVVLDDDSDASLIDHEPENVKSSFVETSFETGLDEAACQKIIESFNS